MWDARPGMKVVCIKDFDRKVSGVTYPIKNLIYTIREVGSAVSDRTQIMVLFDEIEDQELIHPSWGKYRAAWPTSHFRPLKTTDKGMEVLRSILANPKGDVTGFEQTKVKKKVKA